MKKQDTIIIKEKTGKVYLIVSPKGKRYVGSTRQKIYQRWGKYKGNYEGCKEQRKIHRSLVKYGWKAHTFEVIWEGPFELMLRMEHLLGLEYNVLDEKKGLNLSLPGYDDVPAIITQETRDRISAFHKGRKKPERSEQNRINIGNASRGRKNPKAKAQILKVIEDQKIPVLAFCKYTGLFIKEYSFINGAGRELKIQPNSIYMCCRGKYNFAGAYIWKYKSDFVYISESITPLQTHRKDSTAKKSVIQIDPETNTELHTWPSANSAGKSLGVKGERISEVCKGSKEIAAGFKWQYKN